MRIAVTGGAGFIGSHVVDRLAADGHELVVVDLRPPHRADVRHEEVDLLDLPGLVRATRRCDAVFHLAGVSNVDEAAAHPVMTADVNVVGTVKVWEAARRNDIARAVLASTVWVYAGASGDGPLTEDAPIDLPASGHIYTSSKIAAEMLVHNYRALYDQEFTILRYGIPYGPRMRPQLVIPRFVNAALAGEPITVHGDGSQHRNYVYVEDLAEAHVLALHEKGANQVFNLEGAERVTIRHLVDCVRGAVDRPVRAEFLDARPGDYEGRTVSAEKAARVLGWTPAVAFDEGLRRYVEWHVAEAERAVAAGGGPPPSSPAVPAAAAPGTGPARRLRLVGGDSSGTGRFARFASGCAIATLALPALTGLGAPSGIARFHLGFSVLLAVLTAWLVGRHVARPSPPLVGGAVTTAAVWLVAQVSPSPLTWALAVALGAGVGLAAPLANLGRDPTQLTATAAATVTLVGLAWSGSNHALVWAGGLFALVAATATLLPRAVPRPRTRPAALAFGSGATLFTAILASWVGATSASATWFGTLVSHGSRDDHRVAITFDDGLAGSTLAIRDLLDASGVKATFFTGGESIDTRPDLSDALVAHGHLLGNHSYTPNGNASVAWLDPRYRELERAQQAFARRLGVCPTFFRPPSGRHTPLMARVVRHHDMTMVTWDVSTGRRPTGDAGELARRVLDRVRPGSIIDLRVGGDGATAPDGTVLVRALPTILAGLRARHLQPVRLDELLHQPGYAGRC